MPPYADIYVLAPSRTVSAIMAFLDRFAPVREVTASEYEIPQYADSPHTIFRTAHEVVDYCCRHPAETQAIYWRRIGEGDPVFAMVFFTSDGQLVLGLSIAGDTEQSFLAELRAHAGSEIGYITAESPPPDTAAEFRRIAQSSFA